jgi:glycosylphosphatidylinositol transamidase (GPIT) subunit GPI8
MYAMVRVSAGIIDRYSFTLLESKTRLKNKMSLRLNEKLSLLNESPLIIMTGRISTKMIKKR